MSVATYSQLHLLPTESDDRNQLDKTDNGNIISAQIKPECGKGLWWQVAYLNMTKLTHQCPPTTNCLCKTVLVHAHHENLRLW